MDTSQHVELIIMNLFEYAEEFKRAEQELNELLYSEEISGQVVTDTLDSIMLGFEDRAIEIVKMLKNEKAFEASVNNEINRLKEKQLKARKKVKRLEDYLICGMESADIGKIQHSMATFYVRNNRGGLKIHNEELLPHKYKITETVERIDNAGVRAGIESGEVPEIVATIERSKSLIIK